MKKIFTLISMAFIAMSANAQDVYDAIVNGKLAPEFAAVAGDNGGVANNAADGKSIVVMTAGKATVTAVGGTTPANDETQGSGAQQITPGAVIDADKHIYEIASVQAWNDIKWDKKNRGDIDFWYIGGTGNPYVGVRAVETSKDGEWLGGYKADYTYYKADGSLGMPLTGLYYKFTASAKGAFKVKVWANKGTRKTFLVNATTKQAERLLASGYIERVTDENGKLKMLSIEQVDSVHQIWLANKVSGVIKSGKSSLDSLAIADSLSVTESYQYVIGNGDVNFWGWLTFDVEAGEEYWVFQHSSQIGFGGFEFHEGKTADDLINDIVAPYVYTTNFSTYENEETGERVTWNNEKAFGNGQFATESPELDENEKPLNIVPFSNFFRNDGSAKRASYCLLPEDVLAHSDKTQELTIAVWVRSQKEAESANYKYVPLFTAYAAAPVNGANTWPMLACQYRGLLQTNDGNGKWTDYTDAQNVAGKNTEYNGDNDWLKDHKWHHYAAVFEGENAKVFIDGVLKNEWNNDGTTNTQKGLFANGANLKYVCLGGNQAWDWNDNDAPFDFAKLLIKNSKMTAGEIAAQMKADFGNNDMEAYYAEGGETGVKAIKTIQNSNAAIYNLAGQKVSNDFKGIVIQNGRKMIQK